MGVTRDVKRPGSGEKPHLGARVTVHYVGRLQNGTVFDSSRAKNKPFEFRLGMGRVIRGWDEGVIQMNKGELCILTCTHDFAYGPNGCPPVIPPAATLIFEVELLDFE